MGIEPEKVEVEISDEEKEEAGGKVETRKFKMDTLDILAFGFLVLCLGAGVVGIIIANGMAAGKMDPAIGSKLLGGMFGGAALAGIISAIVGVASKKQKK